MGHRDKFFETPNMDRLASEGISFENAFCSCPQCSPSRASLVTGCFPSNTRVFGNVGAAGGNALRQKTVGKMLQSGGYYTAYFGKWHLGKDPQGTAGWDEEFGVVGPETTDDQKVTELACKFLQEQVSRKQPFALFLSYNNPHDIYDFSGGDVQMEVEEETSLSKTWEKQDFSQVPSVQEQFMKEDQGKVIYGRDKLEWQKFHQLYRDRVKLADDEIGKVLEKMTEQWLMNDTILVFTSDHGDMDTNHRLIYKGPFMYEHMIRVPLIFRIPKKLSSLKAGTQLNFNTVNNDLVPTLMDFATGIVPETDGMSLRPLLSGESQLTREFVISQYYSKQQWVNPIRCLRTDQYKYVRYAVHGEELYDLRKDLDELTNQIDNPEYATIKQELSDKLERWMDEHNDPFEFFGPTDREGKAL